MGGVILCTRSKLLMLRRGERFTSVTPQAIDERIVSNSSLMASPIDRMIPLIV